MAALVACGLPARQQPALRQQRRSTSTLARRALRRAARLPPAAAAAAATNGSTSNAGTPIVILPGFLFSARQYAALAADLRAQGHPTEVVPTSFTDWLPSFNGGSFEWYLSRLDKTVADLHARHGRVALVAHSAGGWLARILLGDETYQGVRYGRSGRVHTLLTLGTPHRSIEKYPFGRTPEALFGPELSSAPPEVHTSSLKFVNHFYPTAQHLGGVRVVCCCGDAVRGRGLWGAGSGSGSGSSSEASTSWPDSFASLGSLDGAGRADSRGAAPSRYDAWLAFESYKSGCGRGDVDGDFVTPLCISQLPGAESLLLPGVWHIPRRKAGQLWYGDAPVQLEWLPYLHPADSPRPKAAASEAAL